jgi:mono/diheme cytochrome c family protein
MGAEICRHPFETTTLIAMAAAVIRSRRISEADLGAEQGSTRRPRRAIIPLSVMAAICVASLASCTTPAAPEYLDPASSLVRDGRFVASQRCASCHALDHDTTSPHRDAPPMKDLLWRYDPEMLTVDLIEGIRMGHDDMPRLDLSVLETDALVAYLKSISEPPYPK